MSSQKQHVFSQVPKATIPRSSFDRSFNYKTTVDAGWLYPVYVDEVLPGDTVNLRASLFGRLATPLKPTLDNIYCETFFFFVPTRLVWENWERFMGAQDNPGDSTDYQIPTRFGTPAVGSLFDYMGIPTGVPAPIEFSVLPERCYGLIWNEWFRDQNLQDSITIDKGNTSPTTVTLQRRGKRHDYFTSCLPWPQKSENPVTVPLGLRAPVTYDAVEGGGARIARVADEDNPGFVFDLWKDDAPDTVLVRDTNSQVSGPTLYADLASATGFTINELRQSFAIQKLFERDARGGTRYVESIKSHFGVTSPDFRHQRPEYLGGGHTMVQMNPVPQTVPDEIGSEQTPLANLAAYGVVSDSNHGFTKSFTEHGYIIGLVNFRADLSYQQGLRRMWSRKSRFDFFFPALSHLGEMAVLNKEIYAQGDENDEGVFGYQEAWGDYRYSPSMITGKMRSASPDSLDVWHLAQDFANLPTLSSEFIQDNPPIDRIIAVQDEPHFLLDIYFKQRWARPMPLYGVPGLIDHF